MIRFLSLFLLIHFKLFSTELINYSKDLSYAIESIYRLPEAKELITKATQKGPITLSSGKNPAGKFNGMWDARTRTIYINTNRSHGAIIRTILFELHNALNSMVFTSLWQAAKEGSIDKERFVESAEKHEYDNVLKTDKLLCLGIQRGIFPRDCRLLFIPDFNVHYYYQQLSGHSQWFCKQYDCLCPPHMRTTYRGTMHQHKLSCEDKKDLVHYLNLCRRLCAEKPDEKSEKAYHKILFEKIMLASCMEGPAIPGVDCRRAGRKMELFEEVFKNIF